MELGDICVDVVSLHFKVLKLVLGFDLFGSVSVGLSKSDLDCSPQVFFGVSNSCLYLVHQPLRLLVNPIVD